MFHSHVLEEPETPENTSSRTIKGCQDLVPTWSQSQLRID
jgi:hypothetical protein